MRPDTSTQDIAQAHPGRASCAVRGRSITGTKKGYREGSPNTRNWTAAAQRRSVVFLEADMMCPPGLGLPTEIKCPGAPNACERQG